MVRGGGGGAKKGETAEAEERKRLQSLALRNNLLSETPARLSVGGGSHALSPSKTLIKHHGKEIIRKSQRSGKNRYLFSFPGLLAPISGGKIGELKDLGTKNPVLYLDFPQGQMKLFGTIVYPKNRYLTLQFSRSGKNVVCEDYFDNMIVFSDAWWIGRKDENPEEARLEFPKEMNVQQAVEFDFKGGAGGTSIRKTSDLKTAKDYVPQQSPVHELQYDSSDSQNKSNELVEVTPSRKSARTAGKTKRYVEALSSGDDLVDNGVEITGCDFVDKREETSAGVEEEVALIDIHKKGGHDKTEKSCCKVLELDKEEAEKETPIQKKRKQSTKSVSKSKELARSNQSTMVQATLPNLFKKTEEKISGPKLKAKAAGKRKNGSESAPGKKQSKIEVEDDDIEEFTSTSQDKNTSDEDWSA